MRALRLRPRKRLSQSFLEDQRVAAAIVRAADLDSSQDVLEVGPGLGVLTDRLARAARRVVTVEIDPDLAEELRTRLSDANVQVKTADVLEIDLASLFDAPFVVVANLPYHITSPTLRHLLAAGPPFARRLVVMVQAEVAERIAARPGAMSSLAVTVQAQATVQVVRRVPAAAFYPRPKVDSAVLRLDPIADTDRAIARAELSDFVTLVQAGFKQPRKKVLNSFAEGLNAPRSVAANRLASAGIDSGQRPQDLRLEDWVRLFRTH